MWIRDRVDQQGDLFYSTSCAGAHMAILGSGRFFETDVVSPECVSAGSFTRPLDRSSRLQRRPITSQAAWLRFCIRSLYFTHNTNNETRICYTDRLLKRAVTYD